MKSKGVSGTSGTLAQEVVNGYAEKHRGLLLPTPQTQGLKVCDEKGKTQFMDVNLLPTPIATDIEHKARVEESLAKGRTSLRQRDAGESGPNGLSDFLRFHGVMKQSQGADAGNTSRLSPLFTEEMMGFPLMWTALPFLSESGAPKPSKPTATPSSPK